MDNVNFEKECLELLQDFFLNMNELPPVLGHPRMKELVKPFCQKLQVARVDVKFLINQQVLNNTVQKEINEVIYQNDSLVPNEEKPYIMSQETGEGNKNIYYVYPSVEKGEWNEFEQKQLQVFTMIFWTFSSRVQLINIANKARYEDSVLHIPNSAFFVYSLWKIFEEKQAQDYFVYRFNIKDVAGINANVGRDCGTELIIRYANILKSQSGRNGFVSKLSGTDFIGIATKENMQQIIRTLEGTPLDTNMPMMPTVFMQSTSAIIDLDKQYKNPMEVVDLADDVYNLAKAQKVSLLVYDEEIKETIRNERIIKTYFEQSLENEEFKVCYQPKVLANGRVLVGAEALCRWIHDGEIISPQRFIPILENNGKINHLDLYMAKQVCKDIRYWLDNNIPVVKISINLSRISLHNPRIIQEISNIIDNYNIPHEYLEFEITESAVDVDASYLQHIVQSLNSRNLSVAIDDFGT